MFEEKFKTLKIGDVIENKELVDIFGCAPQGGMRRSIKNNILVLISDNQKSLYENRWEGDIIHYTGMGTKGNQRLDWSQNKTLYESYNKKEGEEGFIDVVLFEVMEEKKYTYRGFVKLIDDPYTSIQPDSEGEDRNVYIFPLKVLSGGTIDYSEYEKIYKEKGKKSKRKSNIDIENKSKEKGKNQPSARYTRTCEVKYDRDPDIVEYAKRRANGKCELCLTKAPFCNKAGEPYLETHHIKWLSKEGLDTIQNTVALCPNCHKKVHVLDDKKDVEYLKNIEKYIK